MAGPDLWIAVGTMLLVYALIATERMHRTTATLLGVSVLLFFQFVVGAFVPSVRIWRVGEDSTNLAVDSFHAIVEPIDLNVVFLLFGMMVVVAITAKTRIFQWVAFQMYRIARGRPLVLLVLLSLFTGITSAFIDNVTTMLLVTPLAIEISLVLGVNSLVFLLPLVFASNIGGAATLVGDPPNILVGSHANLTFVDFLVGLLPAISVAFAVFMVYMWLRYGRQLRDARPPDVEEAIAALREVYRVPSWRTASTALAVLALVVVLFLIHGTLQMEVAVPALIGAGLLLVISKQDVVRILEEVEWPTLVFFMMLFVIVGAVAATGALDIVAHGIAGAAGGSPVLAIVLIVWASAVLSAVVDNIPFTATMLPVISALVEPGGEFAGNTGLWWALLLGADLGGNATIMGASANIVTAGLAERAGHPIGFVQFMKHGIPVVLLTCAAGTLVLLFEWGRFG